MGRPGVFLRLAGCNLRCLYCDTAYAWEGGEGYSVGDLVGLLKGFPCRYLVVTGGEPLLQADALGRLIRALSGWTFTIETNATIWEPDLLSRFSLVTASPKLQSAGVGPFPHESFSRYVDVLPPRLQVKLVVDKEDWEELECLLARYPQLGREIPLVIQPVERAGDPLNYLSEVRMGAEAFLREMTKWRRQRVRFLPQLHKLIWWGRRGV